MRQLVPYAGAETFHFARKPASPETRLLRLIHLRQRKGLLLTEIATDLGEPVERIHAIIMKWLGRGR